MGGKEHTMDHVPAASSCMIILKCNGGFNFFKEYLGFIRIIILGANHTAKPHTDYMSKYYLGSLEGFAIWQWLRLRLTPGGIAFLED